MAAAGTAAPRAQGLDTRQRLIEAAEQLFATRGIDAVSLAEVTAAAGLNNTGAVHYHFGGREELLAAIVEQHREDLDVHREGLFDELEARGDTSLESLIRVLVEPLAAKLDDPRGRAFLSIQAQRFTRPRPAIDAPRPVVFRYLRLLGLTHLPREITDLVTELARLLVFGAFELRARQEGEGTAPLPRDVFVDELVGAVVRVLHVPPERRRALARRVKNS